MKKSYVYLIIVALLVVIIFLLVNFINTPVYKFASVQSKDMEDCANASYTFTPDIIAKAIINKDDSTILVDVRSKHDYINGHLTNAKHIDKASVLEKENYQFFSNLKRNNKQVIFYGKDVVEANIPFMILKQMGIDHIGISCKGYDFFDQNELHHLAITKSLYANNETAVANIANYIVIENQVALERAEAEKERIKKALARKKAEAARKKRVVFKKKPKPSPVQEEEEEEGC